MFTNIVLLLGKVVRLSGSILLKIAQYLEKATRSRIIERGTSRDLYLTRFNDLFWLDNASYVDKCIKACGIFEEQSTQVVKRLVKHGDIVFDVGANIGYYSILLSKLVGDKGKVLCFEPTEHYRTVLNINLEANHIHNVEVFSFGLSNKSQQLEIQIGSSSASLHNPGCLPSELSELITLRSLDNFTESLCLERIDFIKVDIDGHEPLFLEGAWKTLEKYNPVILLEISHLHYLEAGYTAWDFYETLTTKGYKIFHEDGLVEIQSKVEFLIKCGNFANSSNVVISRKDLDI